MIKCTAMNFHIILWATTDLEQDEQETYIYFIIYSMQTLEN